MQKVKLKAKKHLIVIQVPSDMSTDAMAKLSRQLKDSVPGLNVLVSQSETEMTVLTLED